MHRNLKGKKISKTRAASMIFDMSPLKLIKYNNNFLPQFYVISRWLLTSESIPLLHHLGRVQCAMKGNVLTSYTFLKGLVFHSSGR